MALTDDLKELFKSTAKALKGHARRVFMAKAVKLLGKGGQRRAEEELDWNRGTVRKGIHELESGTIPVQAVKNKVPHAEIVADRFHVVKNLNKAVTKARRDIQRTADEETKECLKGSRWVLVTNEENLSNKGRQKLAEVYETSPELKQLHQGLPEF